MLKKICLAAVAQADKARAATAAKQIFFSMVFSSG